MWFYHKNHDVYGITGKPSWIQMLLVVSIHITEQLLCMCMQSSYQECAAHYLYVYISHMTLKQT